MANGSLTILSPFLLSHQTALPMSLEKLKQMSHVLCPKLGIILADIIAWELEMPQVTDYISGYFHAWTGMNLSRQSKNSDWRLSQRKCQPLMGVKDWYMNSRSLFRKRVHIEEKRMNTYGGVWWGLVGSAWGLVLCCIISFNSYNNSLR